MYIDLIDANKERISLARSRCWVSNFSKFEKKEERIKEFVAQIMEKYPPGI